MGTKRLAAAAVCAFACACNEPPIDQPANHATAPTPAIPVAVSPQDPATHQPETKVKRRDGEQWALGVCRWP